MPSISHLMHIRSLQLQTDAEIRQTEQLTPHAHTFIATKLL